MRDLVRVMPPGGRLNFVLVSFEKTKTFSSHHSVHFAHSDDFGQLFTFASDVATGVRPRTPTAAYAVPLKNQVFHHFVIARAVR